MIKANIYKNYYKILDISSNIGQDKIKKKYKELDIVL